LRGTLEAGPHVEPGEKQSDKRKKQQKQHKDKADGD
jgi:hypothetical protein